MRAPARPARAGPADARVEPNRSGPLTVPARQAWYLLDEIAP